MTPTPGQAMLLSAALRSGPEALEAWRTWCEATDLDEIDGASCALLPEVARNLIAQGHPELLSGKVRGIQRHAWLAERVRERNLAGIVRVLRREGIGTLLLDPVGPHVHVRVVQARAALRRLRLDGWRPPIRCPEPLRLLAGHVTLAKGGGRLVLSWDGPAGARTGKADAERWEAAVVGSVAGEPTRLPCPSDRLLQLCLGVSGSSPDLGRVTELGRLVGSTPGPLLWQRFVHQACLRRCTTAVDQALRALAPLAGVSVPEAVSLALAAASKGPIEIMLGFLNPLAGRARRS